MDATYHGPPMSMVRFEKKAYRYYESSPKLLLKDISWNC